MKAGSLNRRQKRDRIKVIFSRMTALQRSSPYELVTRARRDLLCIRSFAHQCCPMVGARQRAHGAAAAEEPTVNLGCTRDGRATAPPTLVQECGGHSGRVRSMREDLRTVLDWNEPKPTSGGRRPRINCLLKKISADGQAVVSRSGRNSRVRIHRPSPRQRYREQPRFHLAGSQKPIYPSSPQQEVWLYRLVSPAEANMIRPSAGNGGARHRCRRTWHTFRKAGKKIQATPLAHTPAAERRWIAVDEVLQARRETAKSNHRPSMA